MFLNDVFVLVPPMGAESPPPGMLPWEWPYNQSPVPPGALPPIGDHGHLPLDHTLHTPQANGGVFPHL